jgi:hypothetical protein
MIENYNNIRFIKKEKGKMGLISPYNSDLVYFIKRNLRGKWEDPYWIFNEKDIEKVKEKVSEIFFVDFIEDTVTVSKELVDIIVNTSMYHKKIVPIDDNFIIFGTTLIRKYERDTFPKIDENVIVLEGSIPSHGGSRANPRINPSSDCVLVIREIPVSIVKRFKEKYDKDNDCIKIIENTVIIQKSEYEKLNKNEKSIVDIMYSLLSDQAKKSDIKTNDKIKDKLKNDLALWIKAVEND